MCVNGLFAKMAVPYACAMPTEARRGSQSPELELAKVVMPYGCWTTIWIRYKSSQRS